MPYLKQEDKYKFLGWFPKANHDHLYPMNHLPPSTPGELNYLFTEIIKLYTRNGTSYQKIKGIWYHCEYNNLPYYRDLAIKYPNIYGEMVKRLDYSLGPRLIKRQLNTKEIKNHDNEISGTFASITKVLLFL